MTKKRLIKQIRKDIKLNLWQLGKVTTEEGLIVFTRIIFNFLNLVDSESK